MKDLSTINLKPKNVEEALETISQLAQLIVELKEENTRLKEQLNTNSKNSSLPPSRDLKKKKQTKAKSNKNRGGQPGHKAHQRVLVDIDQVAHVIICTPPTHCECGTLLGISDGFERHQVYELPQPRYEGLNYRNGANANWAPFFD